MPSPLGLYVRQRRAILSTSIRMPMSGLHTFTTSMSLPLPRDQVFAFFADATNLQRITPPELGFAMVTPHPIDLCEGTRIEYRLHLFGLPFAWQCEIQRWNPPDVLLDAQPRSPDNGWGHARRLWADHPDH